jgi:hypothetical protein
MGHAGKRECKKGWGHRSDGRKKNGFEWVFHPPAGEWNRLPIATGVASKDAAESIHFAPPLTSSVSMIAKLCRF